MLLSSKVSRVLLLNSSKKIKEIKNSDIKIFTLMALEL